VTALHRFRFILSTLNGHPYVGHFLGIPRNGFSVILTCASAAEYCALMVSFFVLNASTLAESRVSGVYELCLLIFEIGYTVR